MGEDVGRQDVAADDREVRRGLLRRRLLHEIGHQIQPIARRPDGHHAVVGAARPVDALHGDDRTAPLRVDVDHLPHHRRAGVDDVVPQEDGERLVPHEIARHEDGVAEPERLLLPHVRHADHVGDRADLLEQIQLRATLQQALQLVGDVEMILDGGLAASGDDDDRLDPRGHRLLDDVLDDRLVDQGQHLLGLGLGGGKETRAHACGGEDRLTDRTGGCHGVGVIFQRPRIIDHRRSRSGSGPSSRSAGAATPSSRPSPAPASI